MVVYKERYELENLSFGIEDYEQPGEHFFEHEYKPGKSPRFRVWCNGCGIGRTHSKIEAKILILEHATFRLTAKWTDALDTVREITDLLKIVQRKQGSPSQRLAQFKRTA